MRSAVPESQVAVTASDTEHVGGRTQEEHLERNLHQIYGLNFWEQNTPRTGWAQAS
jgi:hypothetical protein